MSKASLYGYFRAKDEIVAAISRETIRDSPGSSGLVRARACPGGQAPPRRPAARALRHRQRSFLTVFFSEERACPRASPVRLAGRRTATQGVESIWSRASGAASSGTCRPASWVYGLLGMLNLALQWYNPRPLGAEEVSGAFLAPRGGRPAPSGAEGAGAERQLRRLKRELQSVERALDA